MQRMDCILKVILFLSFGLCETGHSQNWDWFLTLGDTGQESAQGLVAASDGALYVYGTFTGEWELGPNTLSSVGEDDVFLLKIQPDQEVEWAFNAGSNLDDQMVAVTTTPDGHLLTTGTYWQSIQLGALSLNATLNAKGIYFAQLDDDGQVLWAKGINGTDLKQVEALEVDDEGNSYLTGYFSGMLVVEDQEISARGETDLFLVSYDSIGELRWVQRAGYSGDTRALALEFHPESGLIVAGIFNDTTLITDTLLPAETYDDDVFIASYNQQGEAQWVHKAGGVLDESITHLATDEAGNIYVTGYLVGVMDLHNGQAIQSNTTNSDFYLLKYSSEGAVIWAFAYGGDEVQQTRGLALAKNQILLSGYFRGPMSFGSVTLDAGNNIQGFVAGFDEDGQPKWGFKIAGDGLVLPVDLVQGTEGELYLAGSFSENLYFDETQNNAAGNYDLFIGRLADAVTPVNEVSDSTEMVTVFPNPAKGQLLIRTAIRKYDLALINPNGKLVFTGQNETAISLEGLPTGVYILLVNSAVGHFSFPIVIE